MKSFILKTVYKLTFGTVEGPTDSNTKRLIYNAFLFGMFTALVVVFILFFFLIIAF